MIKLKNGFKKESLNIKNKEDTLLLEIEGILERKEITKRKKLNISLAIDISGSMSDYIDNDNRYPIMHNLAGLLVNKDLEAAPFKDSQRKMDLAKEAAINSIKNMNDGDFVSVIAFDDRADIIQEAIEISKENKEKIIDEIKKLKPRNMTDIHGGWLASIGEVSKNLNSKNLNRVIIITDGLTNYGITNTDNICNDVFSFSEKEISTSTFGVGKDFNEDLLLGMSKVGNGNFYFIDSEDKFNLLFNEEFDGLSNIAATNIKLKIKLNKEYSTIKEVMSDLKKENGYYFLPDLINNRKLPMLFKINTKNLIEGQEISIGTITIKYNNELGEKINLEEDIIVKVSSEEEWCLLEENTELKIQELLYMVSKKKMKAREFFEKGDRDMAKNILKDSTTILESSNIQDDRIKNQTNSLNASIIDSETKSLGIMSKTMHYESYRTSTGKEL